MDQYSEPGVDATFSALSDPTRRGVLDTLAQGDASITDLAARFSMTLTGMKKHVGVLERAGLVSTQKIGRTRTCRLGARDLSQEAAWIEDHRLRWAARFDALDTVIQEISQEDESHGKDA
ncbi:helix-turn-helix transcriptional regulator [Maritimibacter sp. DP1N21-5]|uniref:ArsR/SmtB family transcription factor n=1 Tax=Maritimibacter sp. DP1N21-5 TaxID=2836867 RepID=UPI001C47F08D|nr:metalloregulator ArsR/SmtB family transcription factor [Maritimibacter sp. DP1N21-5]MBV7409530.1 metalloregulator ArsR/SmtB family transcription factor [Maritimibacter sp. DP1N21-5]